MEIAITLLILLVLLPIVVKYVGDLQVYLSKRHPQ